MATRILLGCVAVIAVIAAAFTISAWRREIPPIDNHPQSFDQAMVARGAELAAVGACAVCHTRTGGKPYAGGYGVQSPFGTIYGTNVTPDPDTGIGTWSIDAFRRAMREGVSRKGEHLYPAFPYDHFTHLTDYDIDALYAFLMTREPVRQANVAPELPFPLNVRLAAAAWKVLFLGRGGVSAQVSSHGQYLADALGHCGACHTPRNFLGAEQRDKVYAGGVGEGWTAPALNQASPAPVAWTADELFAYLRDGFADNHGIAAGPMAEVVQELKTASADDVRAIAHYIASLQNRREADSAQAHRQTPKVEVLLKPLRSTTGSNASAADEGEKIFVGACASCHHGGGGLPVSRPVDLGLSTPVHEREPDNLLHIILTGIHPPAAARGFVMPGFDGALTDQQITALANYIRTRFTGREPWSDLQSSLQKVRRQHSIAQEAP